VNILTVDSESVDMPKDSTLSLLESKSCKIHKVRLSSGDLIRKRLRSSDLWKRSKAQFINLGSSIIARENVDVVFTATARFAFFELGSIWKEKHQVPFVVDIQDQWRTSFYKEQNIRPPGGWLRYNLSQYFTNKNLSPAFNASVATVSVNDEYRKSVANEFPSRNRKDVTIPIGTNHNELSVARRVLSSKQKEILSGDVVFLGGGGDIMEKSFHYILRCVKLALHRRQFRVTFGGFSYASKIGDDFFSKKVGQIGLEDSIKVYPGRLSHLSALRIFQESKINLVLGTEDPHYTPSRLSILSRIDKPTLIICRSDSAIPEQFLSIASFHYLFYDHDAEEQSSRKILELLESDRISNMNSKEEFVDAGSSQIEALFNEVLQSA